MLKIKDIYLDKYTDMVYDQLFETTCNIITDELGYDTWDNEYQDLHSELMYKLAVDLLTTINPEINPEL